MAARATCSQELSFRDEGKLCHACLKRTTVDNAYRLSSSGGASISSSASSFEQVSILAFAAASRATSLARSG